MKNKPENLIVLLIKKDGKAIIDEYADVKALMREQHNMPKVRTKKVRDKKGFSTKNPIL